MKVSTGNIVQIIAGKDRGKKGAVLRVYKNQSKVLVENLNMFKKNVKKSEQYPQGGVIDVPRPIHVSNVKVLESKKKEQKDSEKVTTKKRALKSEK